MYKSFFVLFCCYYYPLIKNITTNIKYTKHKSICYKYVMYKMFAIESDLCNVFENLF